MTGGGLLLCQEVASVNRESGNPKATTRPAGGNVDIVRRGGRADQRAGGKSEADATPAAVPTGLRLAGARHHGGAEGEGGDKRRSDPGLHGGVPSVHLAGPSWPGCRVVALAGMQV